MQHWPTPKVNTEQPRTANPQDRKHLQSSPHQHVLGPTGLPTLSFAMPGLAAELAETLLPLDAQEVCVADVEEED